MAKGAYIGVQNAAGKLSKGYIGVDGTARTIKKAYVGVGGVARLFWSARKKLAYDGAAPALGSSRVYHSAASIANTYALFLGGSTNISSPAANALATVDAYDPSLVKTTATLHEARYNAPAIGSGSYAYIFFGVYNNSSGTYTVPCAERFDASLTRTLHSATFNRATHREHSGIARLNEQVLLVGGRNTYTAEYYTEAFSFDSDFTRSARAALSTAKYEMGEGSTGAYAVFAGGYGSSGPLANVEAYDPSFVKTTAAPLSAARNGIASMMCGKRLLLSGGYGTAYCATVDVYDEALTHTTLTGGVARARAAGFSGETCCGAVSGSAQSGRVKTVDFYDSDLTRTSDCEVATARDRTRCAVLGSRVIVGGGSTSASTLTNTAEVFSIIDA